MDNIRNPQDRIGFARNSKKILDAYMLNTLWDIQVCLQAKSSSGYNPVYSNMSVFKLKSNTEK